MEGDKQFKLGTRFLGSTGTLVSDICLGTMTFSLDGFFLLLFPTSLPSNTLSPSTGKGPWGMPAIDQDQSFQRLNRYKDVGGNFLDTADVYGTSEQVVGK
jgi:aryl-alcohol dehydrogenase-like predicted oxidoreductase